MGYLMLLLLLLLLLLLYNCHRLPYAAYQSKSQNIATIHKFANHTKSTLVSCCSICISEYTFRGFFALEIKVFFSIISSHIVTEKTS